ncbi:MAG: hypothetical protein LBK67_01675 [Coriobacteriales bacterium]|jgi:hypothetical protein|nr:hypothetical protein [Coriobacteriales bacterium]
MAIIHQHDKRSGLTYVYESHSYWDKEKKVSRAKRKLIGRLDTTTGAIVATDGRCKKDAAQTKEAEGTDYKKLCAQLEKRCAALEALVDSLQKENA